LGDLVGICTRRGQPREHLSPVTALMTAARSARDARTTSPPGSARRCASSADASRTKPAPSLTPRERATRMPVPLRERRLTTVVVDTTVAMDSPADWIEDARLRISASYRGARIPTPWTSHAA
jgi:hypothetical protein